MGAKWMEANHEPRLVTWPPRLTSLHNHKYGAALLLSTAGSLEALCKWLYEKCIRFQLIFCKNQIAAWVGRCVWAVEPLCEPLAQKVMASGRQFSMHRWEASLGHGRVQQVDSCMGCHGWVDAVITVFRAVYVMHRPPRPRVTSV